MYELRVDIKLNAIFVYFFKMIYILYVFLRHNNNIYCRQIFQRQTKTAYFINLLFIYL